MRISSLLLCFQLVMGWTHLNLDVKWNVNNKECPRLLSVSCQCFGSSMVSPAYISSTCFVWRFLETTNLLCSSFGFTPITPPTFYFSTDKSVWQVPGSIGVGAHGWKAQVYQPCGCNSVYGLALSKVEARGHPGHPPPVSRVAVVNTGLFSSFLISLTWKN